MKKNNLQKVLAATLASVMVVGTLTACGGGDDANASASASGSTPASTGSTAASTSSTSNEASSQPAADAVAGIDGRLLVYVLIPRARKLCYNVVAYGIGLYCQVVYYVLA